MPNETTTLTCRCDYDCGGDPLAFFRCNRKTLCPAHDECEGCNATLATAMVDGDKLCDACQKKVAALRDGCLANEEEEKRVHADFEHVDAEASRDIDKAL